MAEKAEEAAPLPELNRVELEAILAREALRGERTISILRSTFCALILARFVVVAWFFPDGQPRSLIEIPALVGMIVASLALLSYSRRPGASPRLLMFSAVLDAFGCFLALLPNVLWPWDTYGGLLAIPDSAALLVLVAGSAFRLLPRAILAGVIANIVSAAGLLLLDMALNRSRLSYQLNAIPLFLLFMLAMAAAAFLFAKRTLRVVEIGASAMLQVERARGNLGLVLSDHHDVRTALSTGLLEAGLIRRELAAAEIDRRRLETQLDRLDESQEQIAAFVARIRDRTMRELKALRELSPAEVGGALSGVVSIVGRRYREVTIDIAPEADGAAVMVAGGAGTLERVLLNVLVNACEGDGRRGAGHVEIGVRRLRGSRMAIDVRDDGPGFGAGERTKPGGLGFGLQFIKGVVEASAGTLRRRNRAEGGAEVTIELLEATV